MINKQELAKAFIEKHGVKRSPETEEEYRAFERDKEIYFALLEVVEAVERLRNK